MQIIPIEYNHRIDQEMETHIKNHMEQLEDVEIKYQKNESRKYAVMIIRNHDNDECYIQALSSYWNEGINGYCGIHLSSKDTTVYGHCFRMDIKKTIENRLNTLRGNL